MTETTEPIEVVIARLRDDLSRGFMVGDQVADDLARLLDYVEEFKWRPIETLRTIDNNSIAACGFRIFAPSLIHLDFNPSGTAEATLENYCDDSAIFAARWNGQYDCYDTVEVTDATHWMPPLPPPPVKGDA